jgi:hypothetical protein
LLEDSAGALAFTFILVPPGLFATKRVGSVVSAVEMFFPGRQPITQQPTTSTSPDHGLLPNPVTTPIQLNLLLGRRQLTSFLHLQLNLMLRVSKRFQGIECLSP